MGGVGIPLDQQHLSYRQVELKNGHTLADYNIKKGETVKAFRRGPLYIKTPTGKTITLMASAMDTIDNVRHMIQDQTGIPLDKQELTFEGRVLSEKRRGLKRYNIRAGNTLKLRAPSELLDPPPTWLAKVRDMAHESKALFLQAYGRVWAEMVTPWVPTTVPTTVATRISRAIPAVPKKNKKTKNNKKTKKRTTMTKETTPTGEQYC